MNAICLVIDGLNSACLGAYGNTWLPTPEFDRLAANSFLLDQAYIDSPRLETAYRSFWTGLHAQVKPALVPGVGLAEQLSDVGVNTSLVCDDPLIAEHPLAQGFRQKLLLRPPVDGPRNEFAADLSETQQAIFFAELVEQLTTSREPYLLWAHTQGLIGPWDAPWELRARLLAEEEDDLENVRDHLAELRHAPHAMLPPDTDPDDLLALRLAYAAQVQVLDQCLAAFLHALDELAGQAPTLLTILAPRGFALGSHRRIGHESPLLHEELTHIPWLLRLPDRTAAADRSQALVQPADLPATLLEWFGISSHRDGAGCGQSLLPLASGTQTTLRDRLLLTDEASTAAIRTPGWYLIRERRPPDENELESTDRLEMYAKPDDRWELNEVADRCPEIASELENHLHQLETAVGQNQQSPLAPLGRELVEGFS